MASFDLPAVAETVTNPALDPRAGCRGHTSPDLWFPAPTDDWSLPRDICIDCPVRALCLQWAMATRQSGVWGGELLDRGKPDWANTKWRNPYPRKAG